jgi:16S rRNA (uracil1498-N3)-methyltransferase
MSRRRFYVARNSILNGMAVLQPSQAHHLRNVLRMSSGDAVEVFDDEGSGYIGTVELHESDVLIRLLSRISVNKDPVALTLAVALIKSIKFEWILQKATELGVADIIPLVTRLSEIQIPGGKIISRLERWNNIVREASKQCGRFQAPQIHTPLNFQALLASEEMTACTKYLFYEKAGDYWRPDQHPFTDRIVLCLGPEGGWTSSEVEQANNAGYKIYGLGPLILRAETAAIAAVAILKHQIYITQMKSV